LREKTHAHRKLNDNVPEDVKQRRLEELINVYRKNLILQFEKEVGTNQLVLIDSPSKKNPKEEWVGRTDGNKKVILKKDTSGKYGIGDYVALDIERAGTQILYANNSSIQKTTLQDYYN
jgi:tRNA A37 methylthiotransferase MiaB